jgi:Mn2+/Fe2+ NRAMP family transporter
MASIQEMCARIGLVTSDGLTGTIKKNYPPFVLYLMLIFSFPAIVMNIGADIAGMGAGWKSFISCYSSYIFQRIIYGHFVNLHYISSLSKNISSIKIPLRSVIGVPDSSVFV